MPFPLVLCTGILRSGSTWSFNVCRLMAKVVAGREHKPMWSGYLLAEQTESFFKTYAHDRPGPTVIKTHKLTDVGLQLLRSGAAKAICTYRDPRDCVASMMTFAGQPFDIAMGSIAEALKSIDAYTHAGNTLFIRYEDMINDRMKQIERIASYLEVSLDRTLLERIDTQTGLEHAKLACKKMRNQPGKNLLQSMDHRVDPETWLHDNHIQSGKSGRWKDEMNPQQAALLTHAYEPWLRRLGYDADRDWKSAPDSVDQLKVQSGSSAELK